MGDTSSENANLSLLKYLESLPEAPQSPSTPSTSTLCSTESETALSCADFDLVLNLDVLAILKENIIGKAIILKNGKKSKLDARDQNNIAEIIISYFLNKNLKLNNTYLSILAEKIAVALPSEQKSTYYISPIPKKKSRWNKPEVARGKLVDKHRNKLSAIRKELKFSDEDCSKNILSEGDGICVI